MKKITRHILFCAALILISMLLEYSVFLHYDSLSRSPVILNGRMAVRPVYNTDGSWLHGRWGIGYNALLLCLENLAALLFAGYLFRMIASFNAFFGLSERWLYVVDPQIAVAVYRLLVRVYRPYTLDYLYIRGYGTFDLPDFYIGAGIAGLVLWLVPSLISYYRYKRERTAGMGFLQKMKWELVMSGRVLYLPFVKRSGWEERFEKWRME